MTALRRSRPFRAAASIHPIWGLNAGIAALAVGLNLGGLTSFGAIASPHIKWYLIALVVAATERWPVNLQFQRSSHSFSLTDIPVTASLIFLAGPQAVMAVAAGSAVALVFRRLPPIKLVFNLAQFSLAVTLSVLMLHAVAGAHPQFGARLWIGAFLATQVTGMVTIVLLAAVMSLADGRLSIEVVRGMFGMDAVVTAMNTSLALIAAVILIIDSSALPLLVVPALAALIGYRAYVTEHERHQKVEFLYQANRALTESPEVAVAVEGLLRRAREAFRAEIAEVVLVGADDASPLRTRLGPGEEAERLEAVDTNAAAALRTLAGEQPIAFADPVPQEVCDLAGGLEIRNAMVAVLRGKEKPIGTVLIANRMGLSRGFTSDDLALFETLAANASAALQFDRLEQAVTELSELQRQLHHQAYHDPLTGLANRALFTRSIDAALEQGDGVAVMFIDLDDFKGVNDTLGHGIGDQLLCAAASRISGCVRGQELVARLGGDEFAVLITTTSDRLEAVAADVATRVVSSFRLPVAVGERLLSIHLSVGVATNRHSGNLTADLLRDADVAMYEAKSDGKGRYCMFTTEMRETVLRRHIVKEELRDGIDHERLLVQYQPIVDVRTGQVSAVEALVRWEHPERGRIPPLEFVPLAERTGLIVPLGRYVLRRACQQTADWIRAGARPLSVQVNLSARELENPELIGTVAEVLADTGLPPSRLTLEITESVMVRDAHSGGAVLDALRALGVQLALDDFGTGYSSLSYMRSLPLNTLKIAKEFIDGLANSSEDRAFVRLIIELARMRGLRVVAEGIEDAEQLNILRALGCDAGQGFYFARPLDPEDAELRESIGVDQVSEPGPARPDAARADGAPDRRRPAPALG